MFRLQRYLHLPGWNEQMAEQALGYLKDRGFADIQAFPTPAGTCVTGTRGSWLGNITSFDMGKLRAHIRIGPDATQGLCVDLEVETFGQVITHWNIASWRLELIELHRVLGGLGRMDDVWKRYRRASRLATVLWAMTLTMKGARLTRAWEAELRELEAPTAP